MEQALEFFRTYELWIYAALSLGALFYLRKFILAWQELRGAAFGLERENAQARLNLSASVLVLLLTMAVTEFVLVSFIAPMMPQSMPLHTPTVDLLATATVTLAPPGEETPDIESSNPTAVIPQQPESGGCVPGQVEITSPKEGDEVKNIVPIVGTMDFENFGFYKIESRRPDEPIWAILLAGNQPILNGELGMWNTTTLIPGEYQLSVVPVNNEALSLPRCTINVRVAPPDPLTPEP
jgi:hypothetical protein